MQQESTSQNANPMKPIKEEQKPSQPKGDSAKQLTPIEYITLAKNDGYSEDFIVRDNTLHTMNKESGYPPVDVKIIDVHRFEGTSDPGDNSIVYRIETCDGTKGTLSDAYGMYADENVSKFIQNVEALSDLVQKNQEREDQKNTNKQS